jgi:hypothetical protein
MLSLTPALFVENQGQWSDPSVRFVHDGDVTDVAVTDAGMTFQVTRAASGDSDMPVLQFSASFVGGSGVRPVGQERSASVFNYCVGDRV